MLLIFAQPRSLAPDLLNWFKTLPLPAIRRGLAAKARHRGTTSESSPRNQAGADVPCEPVHEAWKPARSRSILRTDPSLPLASTRKTYRKVARPLGSPGLGFDRRPGLAREIVGVVAFFSPALVSLPLLWGRGPGSSSLSQHGATSFPWINYSSPADHHSTAR